MSATSFGFWCQRSDPIAIMDRPHAHGDLEWNYALDCSVVYRHGGRQVTLAPGRLAVFWAGLPHQLVRVDKPGAMVVGVLPLDRFLAWRLPPMALPRLLGGELVIGPADRHGDDGRQLARWCRELAGDDRAAHDLVALEAQARFTRLLSHELPHAGPPPSGLHRLIDALTDPAQATDSVTACAQAAGLNPNYASGLFRLYTGLTPVSFRNGWRVNQALGLLADDRLTISAVARQVGFASDSSFYHEFQRRLGLSPARWRRQQRMPGTPI